MITAAITDTSPLAEDKERLPSMKKRKKIGVKERK